MKRHAVARQLGPWLAFLWLAGGCGRGGVRPERLDDAAMRAWIGGNFAAISGLEQSWRGIYEDGERRVPFRLDLSWCEDSTRLTLRSPFGGELAVLRCRPDQGVGGSTGSSLAGWVARAADAVENPTLRGLLASGAALLDSGGGQGVDVELKDPAIAPLLAVLGSQLPGRLLEGGLCRRDLLAPWLWGEWLPPDDAVWHASRRQFSRAAESWSVHGRSGLVERAMQDGWIIELDEFERMDGIWLAGRMRMSDTESGRRLVLQSRERRIRVQ